MKKTVTIPLIAILAVSIASFAAVGIGPTVTAGAVSPHPMLSAPPNLNPTIVPPKKIYPTYIPPTYEPPSYQPPGTLTLAPTTGGATTAPTTATTTTSSTTSTTTRSTTTTTSAAPTVLVLMPPVGVSKVPKGGIKTGDGSTVRGRR